jgi:hypothetical protein
MFRCTEHFTDSSTYPQVVVTIKNHFNKIYVPAVVAAVENGELRLHELEHGAAARRFEVAGAPVRARFAGGLGGQGREGEGEGESSVRVSTQSTVHSTQHTRSLRLSLPSLTLEDRNEKDRRFLITAPLPSLSGKSCDET